MGQPALGILGVGLAVLAVPLLVVSGAMYVLGGAMKLMADAVESMADAGAIGIIFGLGAAFTFLAVTFPLIAIGAISMTLMTLALLPLSMQCLRRTWYEDVDRGNRDLKPALEDLSGSDYMLDEFLEMMLKGGIATPVFIIAGIAMTYASLGATLLGGALMVLGLGMEMIAPPLESIADSLGGLVNDLTELGKVGPGLIAAAVGIGAIGVALLSFAAGNVINGIASLFSFGGDPIEKFVRLGKQDLPKLEQAGKAIKSFADASSGMGNMEDMLEDVADGLEDIFDIMEDAPRGINETMKAVGEGMKGLLDGFAGANLSADIDYEDTLEGIADGIDEIFGVMEDIDVSLVKSFNHR